MRGTLTGVLVYCQAILACVRRLDAANLWKLRHFCAESDSPEGDCPAFPESLKSLIACHIVISCTKFE